MKRLFCILLALLMLAGCQVSDPEGVTTEPTEPEPTNILSTAQNWDGGALYELDLEIPGLWQYTNTMEFAGNLLLWSGDCHRENQTILDLCLVDPETGTLIQQTQVELVGYQTPQVLGEDLYLLDQQSGTILRLDEKLETQDRWTVEMAEGEWYAGSGKAYHMDWNTSTFNAVDLSSGERTVLLPDANWVECGGSSCGSLRLMAWYDEGHIPWMLDLTTGELTQVPLEGEFDLCYRLDGTWVCPLERDNSICYVTGGTEPVRYALEDARLELLEEGYLLESTYAERQYLRLYTLDGKFVSECVLSETSDCDANVDLIWSEEAGGFFFRLRGFESGSHLMFWDLSVEVDGSDLTATPVPDLGDLSDLRHRADQLEETYGVEIFIGEECDLEYWEFVADSLTDWETVSRGLDDLETALSGYPEDFFRQLTWDGVDYVEIQLVQNLEATDDRAGGSWSAFASWVDGYYLVVADVLTSDNMTYYHEFSHVLDQYLNSYFWNTTGEDFELGWTSHNPERFHYTYDYNNLVYDYDPNYFVDSYSTIKPTEDRARVMEYAMSEGCEWAFEDRQGLLDKLEFYCASIRDAFDTTGWPEVTQWEQYLYLTEE